MDFCFTEDNSPNLESNHSLQHHWTAHLSIVSSSLLKTQLEQSFYNFLKRDDFKPTLSEGGMLYGFLLLYEKFTYLLISSQYVRVIKLYYRKGRVF